MKSQVGDGSVSGLYGKSDAGSLASFFAWPLS